MIQENRASARRVRLAGVGFLAVGLTLAAVGVLSLVRFTWWIPLEFVMAVFALSILTLIAATLRLETNPNITIALIGLALAWLSFGYQPLGPEIRQSGTECIPIEDCIGPVRGGGFPLPYLIDKPGITYWDHLGVEDEFMAWPLILDVIFYFAWVRFAYRLTRSKQ